MTVWEFAMLCAVTFLLVGDAFYLSGAPSLPAAALVAVANVAVITYATVQAARTVR